MEEFIKISSYGINGKILIHVLVDPITTTKVSHLLFIQIRVYSLSYFTGKQSTVSG